MTMKEYTASMITILKTSNETGFTSRDTNCFVLVQPKLIHFFSNKHVEILC